MIKVSNVQVFNFEGAFRGLRNPMNSWALSDSKYVPIIENEKEKVRTISEDMANLYCTNSTLNNDQREGLVCFINDQVISDGLHRNGYYDGVFLGPKDLDLARRMIRAGTDESKFMRQIQVTMDIEAPLFWWKEADTYQVGVTKNSCSTMHKICSSPITEKNFSFGDGYYSLNGLDTDDYLLVKENFKNKIEECEWLRQKYLEYTEKAKTAETTELVEIWDKRANIMWRTLIEVLPNGWMQKRTVALNYQVLRAMYFARRHHKLKEWRDFCKQIEKLPYALCLICH